MRAFLVVCFCFLVLAANAQVPEKVIGMPIDTSSMNRNTVTDKNGNATVTKDDKPVVTSDSLGPRKHSPAKATVLSMVIPGAGQVYNQKNWWWKVPIIYGGGAALLYGAIYYNKNYVAFRDAYIHTQQYPDIPLEDPRFSKYPDDATLIKIRDNYKQARDQCVIGLGLLYALQIVDAAVEAHFFDFNVNDNLSLNVQPQMGLAGPNYYAGVQMTFKFK